MFEKKSIIAFKFSHFLIQQILKHKDCYNCSKKVKLFLYKILHVFFFLISQKKYKIMMRLFLALKFVASPEYVSVIEELKHLLRRDSISWADPNLAHLTLKFFGNTPDYKMDKINKQLELVSHNLMPIDFSISKIGAFGSSYKPQVLWFGIDKEEELKNIHSEIMNALKPIDYFPDAGNFVPHITFARIHKTTDKTWFWKCVEKFQTHPIQKVEIDKIHLIESRLTPEKAIHNIIRTFDFSKK